MKRVDALIAELTGLNLALLHACLRLEAGTDAEALHDLRIALQRLRSLLAPLRRVADLSPLYNAAANLAALTAPVRDLEVLATELDRQGYADLAAARRARLPERYAAILDSVELERLLALLDVWPAELRDAQRDGELRELKKLIARRLHKQTERLRDALACAGYDRHRLRLLIKRVRYASEAYPKLCDLSKASRAELRRAQSALGDWHDHFQWCLRSDRETDLQPLRALWQERGEAARSEADAQLRRLAKRLPSHLQRREG